MSTTPDQPSRGSAAPESAGVTIPTGWTRLPLEHLPAPTFWPAGLALGITFIFWALITSWVVLVIGIALFAASLAGWISDLRHEPKHHP